MLHYIIREGDIHFWEWRQKLHFLTTFFLCSFFGFINWFGSIPHILYNLMSNLGDAFNFVLINIRSSDKKNRRWNQEIQGILSKSKGTMNTITSKTMREDWKGLGSLIKIPEKAIFVSNLLRGIISGGRGSVSIIS